MSNLEEILAQKIPQWRAAINALVKEHGAKQIDKVSVAQIFGGLRGVRALSCDTSSVEPQSGLLVRGRPIKELAGKLPEEIFFLLLTGELPDAENRQALIQDLAGRAAVPDYVRSLLQVMPKDCPPMTQLSAAILVMERESVFRRKYSTLKKFDFWQPMLEDCLNVIACTPVIAAEIYRRHYGKGPAIDFNERLDWAANFAAMLGVPDQKGHFAQLIRLFMTLHCDHEGGPVSALAAAVVSSAFSDIYYALSAGYNGLAGPLHGRANQDCLAWILKVKERFGGVPKEEDLRSFAKETLSQGRVIPGYGHAVLRVPDPRFEVFMEFGRSHEVSEETFQIALKLYEVVPGVLKELGKVSNPWPNVDAISGSLLYSYGLKEFDYYTVLFSVSRALGICSQIVLARALDLPMIRPRSVTTPWVQQAVGLSAVSY